MFIFVSLVILLVFKSGLVGFVRLGFNWLVCEVVKKVVLILEKLFFCCICFNNIELIMFCYLINFIFFIVCFIVWFILII